MEKITLWQEVLNYAAEQYGVAEEHVFQTLPEAAVLRRGDNRKWFGLLMPVEAKRLGLNGDTVEVMNVKCDSRLVSTLRQERGFLPAYHMNKENWITILLDGSVPMEHIQWLLDMSFDLVASSKKKRTAE